jgi:hypothetical protein
MHGRRKMQKTISTQVPIRDGADLNKYPIYWHRDTGCTLLVHGVELDNRWVVLHNVYLLTIYNAHINVEICNNIHAVKYLFKYVYKRHDHAIVEISC